MEQNENQTLCQSINTAFALKRKYREFCVFFVTKRLAYLSYTTACVLACTTSINLELRLANFKRLIT